MIAERTLQLGAACVALTDLRFRVVFKCYGQMAADKTAERLMQALRFLHVKRQRGVAFRQTVAFDMQQLQLILTRGTTKQRHFWKTRIAPLPLGDFHHDGFFQLFNAKYAVIKRLRIAFDQVEIFGTIFQSRQLLADQGEIRHDNRVT